MSKNKGHGVNGGARPGAGRKKGGKNRSTLLKENAQQYYIDNFIAIFDDLIQAQKDLALGLWKEQKNAEGEVIRVYKSPPNGTVIDSILDRSVGRVPQPLKHDGTIDSPGVSTSIDKLSDNIARILSNK